MLDLDWLLHPCSKSRFFAEIWQREPALVASDRPDALAGLFSKKDVERIIEFAQPRPPAIRLASAASDERLDLPILPNGRINVDHIRKGYLKGQTLILNAVEDFDPKVASLARAIETEMGARVQVNAYLTPPRAKGFHAHYDTHDVLVVQMEGEKRWKIHDAAAACPLHELVDGDPRPRPACPSPMALTLRPGDVVYIPRGWIHEAETDGEASLHITFGIHPPLAKDLLHAAIDMLACRRPEFRAALPVGALGTAEQQEALKRHFAGLLAFLSDEGVVQDAAEAIDDQMLRRGRSAGDGCLFEDAERLPGLTNATLLERRTNIPCRLVQTEGGLGLQFLNSLIKGPDCFAEALQYVAERRTAFSISDLPGLPPDHQLVLASSLVADGLCYSR